MSAAGRDAGVLLLITDVGVVVVRQLVTLVGLAFALVMLVTGLRDFGARAAQLAFFAAMIVVVIVLAAEAAAERQGEDDGYAEQVFVHGELDRAIGPR